MIIGITNHFHLRCRCRFGHNPGIEDRQIRVEPPGCDRTSVAPQAFPVFYFVFFDHFIQKTLRSIVRMELPHIVFRNQKGEHRQHWALSVTGKPCRKSRIRLFKFGDKRQIIYDLKFHGLATRMEHIKKRRSEQIFPQDIILIPETNIIGGHKFAIGPAQPFTNMKGPFTTILVRRHLIGPVQFKFQTAIRCRNIFHHKLFIQFRWPPSITNTVVRPTPVSAILTDFFEHLHDTRIFRDPFFYRRQLSGLDHLGQHRGLLIFACQSHVRQNC